MKKIFFAFFVLACLIYFADYAMRKTPAINANALGIQPQAGNPTKKPTPSPLPTIDYNATLDASNATKVSAIETANEAGRINAMATAVHDQIQYQNAQLTLENSQLTAEAESRMIQIYSWTATAAGTSIPLTATQQAARNTQEAARITATVQYPTLVIAGLWAENEKKCGLPCYLSNTIGLYSASIFCIGLIVYLFIRTRIDVQRYNAAIDNPKPATVPSIRESMYPIPGTEPGHYRLKNEVPCTPEQFTELAELVVNGERTFGINRLENSSRTLRRSMLYQMRQFYLDNGLANEGAPGTIVLNDAGKVFHENWFDDHTMPDEYKFAEPNEESE